jgi:hypothetical protein
MERLIVVVSKQLLDFLPTRAAAYDSMQLWRRLRAMCQERGLQLGKGVLDGTGVNVCVYQGKEVPSSMKNGGK